MIREQSLFSMPIVYLPYRNPTSNHPEPPGLTVTEFDAVTVVEKLTLKPTASEICRRRTRTYS